MPIHPRGIKLILSTLGVAIAASAWAPLAPGTYTMRYRVLSVDGHVVESQRTTSTSRLRR